MPIPLNYRIKELETELEILRGKYVISEENLQNARDKYQSESLRVENYQNTLRTVRKQLRNSQCYRL